MIAVMIDQIIQQQQILHHPGPNLLGQPQIPWIAGRLGIAGANRVRAPAGQFKTIELDQCKIASGHEYSVYFAGERMNHR